MTDKMTREQAHKNLEEAIENFLATLDNRPTGALLIDWLVISAEHIDRGNGVTGTAINTICPDDQPVYRRLGLLKMADLEAEAYVND